MTVSEVYGPIPTRIQIADAAIEVLRAWLPAYLAEIERQQDLPAESLPRIRSFTTRTQTTKWAEDQTPACVVVCPGLAGPPQRDGQGIWRSSWGLGVAVVTSGNSQESVIANSGFYGAAVRACLLQKQPLPKLDGRLGWLDEDYAEIPESQSRSLSAARIEFEVLIPHTVDDMAGPAGLPPENPYLPPDNWPVIKTTDLETEAT